MTLAIIIVVLAGLWLIAFALLVVMAIDRAKNFLQLFASSFRSHLLEQLLRMGTGAGFIIAAPAMWMPLVWSVMGWVLVATAAALLLLPWRWHQWFAAQVIPFVIRYIYVYAIFSFAAGSLVLYALVA